MGRPVNTYVLALSFIRAWLLGHSLTIQRNQICTLVFLGDLRPGGIQFLYGGGLQFACRLGWKLCKSNLFGLADVIFLCLVFQLSWNSFEAGSCIASLITSVYFVLFGGSLIYLACSCALLKDMCYLLLPIISLFLLSIHQIETCPSCVSIFYHAQFFSNLLNCNFLLSRISTDTPRVDIRNRFTCCSDFAQKERGL